MSAEQETSAARTLRCLELLEQSHAAYQEGDRERSQRLMEQAVTEGGSTTFLYVRGGMTIGEIPQPGTDAYARLLLAQREKVARIEAEEEDE